MLREDVLSVLHLDTSLNEGGKCYHNSGISNICGCCGLTLGLHPLPYGANVVLSSEPIEKIESPKVIGRGRYGITQNSIAIGGGNFLNLRLLHLINPAACLPDNGYNVKEGDTEPLPPPNKDALKVFGVKCSDFMSNLRHGWKQDPYDWDAKRRLLTKEEETEIWDHVRSVKDCYLLFAMVDRFSGIGGNPVKDVLKPAGWGEIVFKSRKFVNRYHEMDNPNRAEYTHLLLIKV